MAWRRPGSGGCGRSAIACARCTGSRSTIRTATRSPSWSRPSSPSTPTTATATAPSRRCASDSPPGRRCATRRSSEVEEAIRSGGLGKQKAPRIQAILERLGEPPDLDWTETAPREESLDFLLELPGVGRKTAACVLIFTWGIPEIPVDVHIHRVGGRLGLFPERASFEKAHDEMLAIVDPEDAYELHMNLIRHGREVCRPKPRCGECALRRMCPWYRAERK